MSKLTHANQIWELTPTDRDLKEGARYAQISLPWTFNRMAHNTSARGQCERALNIAKGIVAQEVLRRKLTASGVKTEIQRKSHRDKDLFDLKVTIDGQLKKLDVKSNVFYTDAHDYGREMLTNDLIIRNAGYSGPDWRHFFPMLVPADQTSQDKDGYCFALARSIDFRKDLTTQRASKVFACFPWGDFVPFLQSKQLCVEREQAAKGVYLTLEWRPAGMFAPNCLKLTVIGEWAGKVATITAALVAGKPISVGPLSCVASLIADTDDFAAWGEGVVIMQIRKNEFTSEVLVKSTGRNVNTAPAGVCSFEKKDFCNLVLPDDYTLHFIGWTLKADFLQACRKYPAWVFPDDTVNKFENGAWTQITESDRKKLERTGFTDCIGRKPTSLNAGWMKMRACCYTYPNQFGGGLRDMNIYVIPQDLNQMATLR